MEGVVQNKIERKVQIEPVKLSKKQTGTTSKPVTSKADVA